jgi:hypothetical protein
MPFKLKRFAHFGFWWYSQIRRMNGTGLEKFYRI